MNKDVVRRVIKAPNEWYLSFISFDMNKFPIYKKYSTEILTNDFTYMVTIGNS